MRTLTKLFYLLLCFLSIYGSCHKPKVDNTPKIINLKTKTLPELKAFLNGTWQMHYAVRITYLGIQREEGNNTFLKFYDVDSVLWTGGPSNGVMAKDKVTYTYIKNSYNDSAYNISFRDAFLYNTYNWTADRMINDTLVFVDNGPEASYFLTKK